MKKINLFINIYSILIILFTGFMVTMSFVSSESFFNMYGITGHIAMKTAWSFKYLSLLLIMIVGFIIHKPETVLLTILTRFFIDITDIFGIALFDTPHYSFFTIVQFLVLMIPQIICLYLLIKLINSEK